MKNKTLIALGVVVLAILCIMGQRHLDGIEQYQDFRQRINVGMIENGGLGKALRENNMLHLHAEDYSESITLCNERFIGPATDEHFILRFRATAEESSKLSITLSGANDEWQKTREYDIHKGEHGYNLNLDGETNFAKLELSLPADNQAELAELLLDHYHFKQPLRLLPEAREALLNGEAMNGSRRFTAPVILAGAKPSLTITPPLQIHPVSLRNLVFNQKRFDPNCYYKATPAAPIEPATVESSEFIASKLPVVQLTMDEADLSGEFGLLNNKEAKGADFEKRGVIKVVQASGEQTTSPVGIRFHGGGPGRTKDIQSYRVYFRDQEFSSEQIFPDKPAAPLRTLVLKYTLQVGIHDIKDSNAFLHAFAFEIANRVGALVPRSQLVNLTLNGKHKGIYLALDHLSNRTIGNWLPDKDLRSYLYTYKKYNDKGIQTTNFNIMASMVLADPEKVYKKMLGYMDEDNLINSYLLTAYIGDDDFCQGVDLITVPVYHTHKLTWFNWDLDHGFVNLSKHKDRPLWQLPSLLMIDPAYNSRCARKMILTAVYQHSKEFRDKVRTRMQEMLAGPLHPDRLQEVLDQYKQIDGEFDHRYADGIAAMEDYVRNRPNFLLQTLAEFDAKNNYD